MRGPSASRSGAPAVAQAARPEFVAGDGRDDADGEIEERGEFVAHLLAVLFEQVGLPLVFDPVARRVAIERERHHVAAAVPAVAGPVVPAQDRRRRPGNPPRAGNSPPRRVRPPPRRRPCACFGKRSTCLRACATSSWMAAASLRLDLDVARAAGGVARGEGGEGESHHVGPAERAPAGLVARRRLGAQPVEVDAHRLLHRVRQFHRLLAASLCASASE